VNINVWPTFYLAPFSSYRLVAVKLDFDNYKGVPLVNALDLGIVSAIEYRHKTYISEN